MILIVSTALTILGRGADNAYRSFAPGVDISALTISPNGDLIILGEKKGRISVWDARRLEKLHELRPASGPLTGVRDIAFSGDGGLVAASAYRDPSRFMETEIKVWDTRTWSLKRHLFQFGAPSAMTFSPDAQMLAASVVTNNGIARDCYLAVWQLSTGDQVLTHELDLPMYSQVINSIDFSQDADIIALSATGGSFLLDLRERKVTPIGEGNGGTFVRFIQQDNALIVSGFDRNLTIWDAKSRKALKIIPGFRYIGAVAWDEPYVVVADRWALPADGDNDFREKIILLDPISGERLEIAAAQKGMIVGLSLGAQKLIYWKAIQPFPHGATLVDLTLLHRPFSE